MRTHGLSVGGMSRVNMQGLVDEYFARRSGVPRTKQTKRSAVAQFARWYDNRRRPVAALARGDIESFLHGQDGLGHNLRKAEAGVTNSSYNKKLGDVKQFVAWLTDNDYVKDARVLLPFKSANRTVGTTPKVRMSLAQIEDALDTCPSEWERWVVAFAFYSMGRESELRDAKLSHFDLTEGTVHWERPKTKRRDGEVWMVDQLREEYLRWRGFYEEVCPGIIGSSFAIPRRYVYGRNRVSTYHHNLRVGRVGHLIKDAAARALGISPQDVILLNQATHIARRSGARMMHDKMRDANIPEPLEVVQAILDHKNRSTTEIYTGIDASKERAKKVLTGSTLFNIKKSNVVELRPVKEAEG